MTKIAAPAQTLQHKKGRKSFYVTEILMLKSIIVLLILTFFLLNEMQAANYEIRSLKKEIQNKKIEMESPSLVLRK